MGDDVKVMRSEIPDQDLEDDKKKEKHYCSCWIFVKIRNRKIRKSKRRVQEEEMSRLTVIDTRQSWSSLAGRKESLPT